MLQVTLCAASMPATCLSIWSLQTANCENLPELDWWKTVKCRMSVSKVSDGKKIVVYDKEIDKRKFDWSATALHFHCT